jgi:GDP-L-fucose synthase
MKILITGAYGMVGSSLRKILGIDHIYHNRKAADLLNKEETERYITNSVLNLGVDTIIHCAAKVGGVQANSSNNETFFIENYIINNNVIDAALKNKVKNFVNLSSTCIFPNENITYPLTADQIDVGKPHISNHGYSYAKRISGYQTKSIRLMTGLNWITVVPTNVYGPNDNFNPNYSHIIPGIIMRAYNCKKNNEKLVVWGDGSPLRQFIHTDDLAKNILWAIENWNSEIPFMAINEKEYSVMDVVKNVADAFKINRNDLIFDSTKPSGQFRKPAKTDIPDSYKFIELKDGLTSTIEWVNSNYNFIRK